MGLPPYEPQQVPEGHYKFKVMAEPDLIKRGGASGKEFITVGLYFKITDEYGNSRYHKESFVPWDKRYHDLLIAFGAKEDKKGEVHLSEQGSVVGKEFEANIIHEPDKDDTTRTWSRITNIKLEDQGDVPPPEKIKEPEEDDEVPF